MTIRLFDTHTHFDLPEFDVDRWALAAAAAKQGVQGLVLIGYLARYFDRLATVQGDINQQPDMPRAYVAAGLHPFYILEHQADDVLRLERFLRSHACIAVGEIGLDTYTDQMKQPSVYQAQKQLFAEQLELAKQFNLPVMLHIRRAHADSLAILKQHRFQQGGIAHSFGGGIQEAKALIKMGFKIGITGQVTDPNAKKLRQVVQQLGAEHLVLETDCPDMTPLCCRQPHERHTRNTPANLPYVLQGLAELLQMPQVDLAAQLWRNTQVCLRLASY
ncbi:MAG: TatD family hydrolase [Pseudomonadota bacterium]|nr:TatD family hydrolase [Pseudomonadota bacterium]